MSHTHCPKGQVKLQACEFVVSKGGQQYLQSVLIGLMRVIGLAAFSLSLACSGGSDEEPTATSHPATQTPTAIFEARATPPESTQPPAPSPTPDPWTRPTFERVDSSQPITVPGAYLLDTETLEVWYLGRGGIWSPDGRTLASEYCCVGREGVTFLEVPGGSMTEVPLVGDVGGLSWSPDSTRLTFVLIRPDATAMDGERAVGVVDREGGDVHEVVVSTPTGAGWVDEVRWVSDDALVMVQRSGNDPAQPVFTYTRVDLATGDSVQLVPGEGGADDPLVLFGEASPDGSQVAYAVNGLHVWDREAGSTTLIDGSGFGPIWSPDGSLLLFSVMSEEHLHLPIWRLHDVDAGTTVELEHIGLFAQWLPDGRLLHAGWWCDYDPATPGGIGGFPDVTVQTIDAGEVRRLSDTPEIYETGVSASPLGDLAVFVPREPIRSLELVELESGAVQTVVRGPDDNREPFYTGAWSSDGRYLTFSYGFAKGLCG